MRRTVIGGIATLALLAPAAPAFADGEPILTSGMEHRAVKRVQKLLGVSPQTGYFGPVTLAAVKTYQRAHGIPTTGVVGPLTWASLLEQQKTKRTQAKSQAEAEGQEGRQEEGREQEGREEGCEEAEESHVERPHSGNPEVRRSWRRSAVPPEGTQRPAPDRIRPDHRIVREGPADGRETARDRCGGREDLAQGRQSQLHAAGGRAGAPRPPRPLCRRPRAPRLRVLKVAASQAGVPYVATGYSPEQGFNCSSYTQWVYEQVGIDLGGAYTVWQYNKSRKISAAEAKPGDLVFFYNYKDNFIGHVGIYAGNGMMWHAPRTGRVVSLERVYTDKVYYGRVLNQ